MADLKSVPHVKNVEHERKQFQSLLVANPNYFGNLANSTYKPVKKIITNTSYEELMCVGLYPEFDTLEAIVYIKQNAGYGGDICSKGTPEYVRFYLSYDNGVTWLDQGVTSFQAQDISGHKPLEYAVQLKINQPKKTCKVENLPKVRAILSWNAMPTAGTPNYTPVWGNVMDGRVQIDTFDYIIKHPFNEVLQEPVLVSLLKENNLIPQNLTVEEIEKLDLEELKKEVVNGIGKLRQTELTPLELSHLYKNQKVGSERYLYPAVQKFSALTTTIAAEQPNYLAGLDVKLSDVVGAISKIDGNTTYEKMNCVGLNTVSSTLEATIKVKKPYGFLGGLCTKGSHEYVAFWMDFGAGWEYMGTTSVKSHDITSLPAEGLDYALLLPVNLNGRRQPCYLGPKTAKVRAILSWETKPSVVDPNYVPVWGNRVETLVLLAPGPHVQEGTHPAYIETVGSMSVDNIDGFGIANGAAELAGFSATDSPFGGEIIVTGHLAYPTDISAGATPLEYQVQVSNDGGATWQTVSNTFSIKRTQLLDGVWTPLGSMAQTAPAGWYTYQEDLTGGPGDAMIFVAGNVLAKWETSASMDGLWQMRIISRVQSTLGPVWISNSVAIMVDSLAPKVSIDITSGGGVCADFKSGDPVSGPYNVSDKHFSYYEFELVPHKGGKFTVNPSGGGSFTGPSPFSRSYPAVSGTGEHGIWKLDTKGIPQCGYVIYLHAWDRTIVNSGYVGRYNNDVVGLCIRT